MYSYNDGRIATVVLPSTHVQGVCAPDLGPIARTLLEEGDRRLGLEADDTSDVRLLQRVRSQNRRDHRQGWCVHVVFCKKKDNKVTNSLYRGSIAIAFWFDGLSNLGHDVTTRRSVPCFPVRGFGLRWWRRNQPQSDKRMIGFN